jgi:hypothetical protein
MKILQPGPDVFLKVAKVSNSYIELEEGISPMPQFASGAFEATLNNITPSTTNISIDGLMLWSQIGNIVTCSFRFGVLYDIEDSSVTFNFDLPVPSNFNASQNCIGTLSVDKESNYNGSLISADGPSLGVIEINGQANSFFTASVTFQYIII